MKPKTLKSYLKLLKNMAETKVEDLKGSDNLTQEEYYAIGSIIAGIQNDLGENIEIYEKFKLKPYNGNF